jgi:uncharacterized membrane protein YkvA (DUF1232 family)
MRHPGAGAFRGGGVLLQPGVFAELRLAWRVLGDDRVSAARFVLPALMALYVISPVDILPDFVLGLGQADDVGVIVVAILVIARLLVWLAPQPIVGEHLRQMGLAREMDDSPTSRDDHVVDAEFTVHGQRLRRGKHI